MCIRIILPPTAEHTTDAQWDLVDILNQALDHDGWQYTAICHSLREILCQTRAQTSSPQQWAEHFAQALVRHVASLQAEADSTSRVAVELERLRLECDSLRRIVADCDAHPLQNEVEAITRERDHWRTLTAETGCRVESLERALVAEQQAHQDDVTHFQEEIIAFNRIIVEQQEALDEHGA